MDDLKYTHFDSFDSKLAKLVQKHKLLYDPGDAAFKNAEAKEVVWQRIAEILGRDVKDAKVRWTRLRERFSREKKRMDLEELRPSDKPFGVWVLYDTLAFLEPFIKKRNRRSMATVEDNLENSMDATTMDHHTRSTRSYAESIDNTEDDEIDSDAFEKDQRLIGLVKTHAILYSRSKMPQRQQLKALAWRQICKLMNMDVSKCRRRWEYLQERYAKECELGRDEDGRAKSTWPHFETMHFVQGYLQNKRLKSETSTSQDTMETSFEEHTIHDFEDDIIEEEEIKHVYKATECENVVYLETAVQDNFPNDITYFENEVDVETREESHSSAPKPQASITRIHLSGDREISAFLNIIESKLDTLKATNKNKAMEDILRYCNAMQDYENNSSEKVPTVVLSCPRCDLHQPSSMRH